MVLMVNTPMLSVVLTMLTRAAITTSKSGEPLRGRAFRSNLRFAPISSAIPLASAPFGRCALRLPKKRTRRADVPVTVPTVAGALRPSPVRAAPRTGSCTTPCSGVRTSADTSAQASGSALRATAFGAGRTARHSSAVAAPLRRLRRRRFPLRSAASRCLLWTPEAVGSHTPRSGLQGVPLASMACPFGDSRCHWVSGCCWTERMSVRHTLLVISWAACGCACHPPIYAHPGTDIRPTYARLSFGRHRCRRLSSTDIRRDASTLGPQPHRTLFGRPSLSQSSSGFGTKRTSGTRVRDRQFGTSATPFRPQEKELNRDRERPD